MAPHRYRDHVRPTKYASTVTGHACHQKLELDLRSSMFQRRPAMTLKHPFTASAIKIQRAGKHLAELEAEIAAFVATSPAQFDVDIVDPSGDAPKVTIAVRFEMPPESLGSIIGDIVHNLRAALDLMACDAVRAVGGNDSGVHFPFCAAESDLDATIKRWNFHRAGPNAVALVRQIKPYRDGINRSISKFIYQAAYCSEGFWKKARIFPGFFCRRRIEETTLLLKSALPVTTIRPTVSAFKCFHTSSSGLRSGE